MLSDLLSKILKAKQPEGLSQTQLDVDQKKQVHQANLYKPSAQAQRWLNQCNFTNLQQKLQFVQNDPQWGPAGYQQLLALDPMLLQNYQLPRSQLDKNISTYMEMLTSAINTNIDADCQQILKAMTKNSKEEIDPDLLSIFNNLKNVLLAYSKYDPGIQQPNISLGCLATVILQNCQGDEVSTFWILISLVENYEMRTFYQKGLPGVALYGEVLDHLMEVHLPAVSYIFKQYHIVYFDYFDQWVKELFSRQIPTKLQSLFIGKFLNTNWPYFYRVCLSLIQSLQSQIILMTELSKSKKLIQMSILKILNFQVPQALLIQQPRASENFKNLNERGSPGSSGSDENFTNSSDDEKSDQKKQSNVTNIKVNRQKIVNDQNNPGILDKVINFFKTEESKIEESNEKILPKKLVIQDFLNRPEESWKYVLEIANQQWISHEGQGTQMEYHKQLIDMDLIQDVLNAKYNVSLKKYLEHQQKQLEIERHEVMARFPVKNLGDPDPNFNNKEKENYLLDQDLGSVIQFDALQASKMGFSHRGSFNRAFNPGFAKGNITGNSQMGLTLNLDFLKDKSQFQTKENLNNIFNDGDVSMLREVDQLFQMFTKRESIIKKVNEHPPEETDNFLNTSRYQGTEGLDSHPNRFLANQQNIGNISVIDKKEELNLESDRNLFRELNLIDTVRQKLPLGPVQEESSRIQITPLRSKLPPKPSISLNKNTFNLQVSHQESVNQTLIMSQFSSPKALRPQPDNNKLGIQSSIPKHQIQRKNKYFEQQLTPQIPPVTPMKLLSSCQDQNSFKELKTSNQSIRQNTGDMGVRNRDLTPEIKKYSNTGGATPQPQRPLPNNEVKIGSFDYYQKNSPPESQRDLKFSGRIQNFGNQSNQEEQDFIAFGNTGLSGFDKQRLRNREEQQSPVISVERNSYNFNKHRIDDLQQFRASDQNMTNGYDRFGNKISNTSLGIATPMRLMVPGQDTMRVTPVYNSRPMSPQTKSPTQDYIASKQESIKQKMQLIQELKNEKRNKMSTLGEKQEKVRMNNTGHSSTGIATNNKSNTRVSKELMNSSNNKSYGSSKYLNQSKVHRINYDVNEEDKSVQQPRQVSPQGLFIKKEKSHEVTNSQKKKMQSAPRGSRQGGEDLYQAQEEKQKKKIMVQNFIENAKKNKFSEWRKSKMGMSDYSEGDEK